MLKLDCQKFTEEVTVWIRETLKQAGFGKAVVALSGGVDSAVVCALAVRALGQENVLVLQLPYGELNREGLADGKLAIDVFDIPKENQFLVDIKQAVDEMTKDLDNLRKGNMMARVRMIYLYDLAKSRQAIVIGTENKTEYYLGYFTRFGDEASDLEPIRSLYKTQVWQLAKYLQVPIKIIQQAPTAGLWEDQTDEQELGFSYATADQVLALHFEQHLSLEEIAELGFPQATAERVLDWVKKMDFKHHLPLVFK